MLVKDAFGGASLIGYSEASFSLAERDGLVFVQNENLDYLQEIVGS